MVDCIGSLLDLGQRASLVTKLNSYLDWNFDISQDHHAPNLGEP